ncbi:MAG: glycoside hydrolase family 31 protein [Acidobacteriota bacterium]|nr:glycoside hydrolase family 31 protein [Acidobacteriota bacterium]
MSRKITALLAACLAVMVSLPLEGAWRPIGAVTASAPLGNQITFRNAQNIVSVTVLGPGIVRVRMSPHPQFGPDFSWAVVRKTWPRTAVNFSGTGETREIRTSDLAVRIQLSPFSIAFYDPEGRLLSKDADGKGMASDGAHVRCWKWMPPDEHYFGLGEKADSLDKRGHSYVMWNTDVFGWGANTDPLYEDVPFFIALRQGKAYGIFFDNTHRSSFDFGTEFRNIYSFGAEGGDLNYYFIAGPGPKDVLERFTGLVGRMPLPPRWALGYQQSRYSYYPEKQVRFIADNFRERHIPCDVIYLDIEYMNGYRVFTWDKTGFPNPSRMLSDLRREGFRVVTIIDPGIKVDPNYWVYQQGLAENDFVRMPDGKIFDGAVWPGISAFPDFTDPRVRDWWGGLYRGLVSDGVAGFWNDMNEPSVFDVPSKTMPLDAIFYDHGLKSPHAKVHNVYGMLMSEATRDGLLRLRPDERPFVLTRDTYAGGQRYAAVWTGDNSSTWNHLRISIRELMGMGLSGLAFAGADIGGFAESPSPDLYTRWLEAGVLYPFSRTHTTLGTREQDPWSYGIRREDINRDSIDLRYRLLPYLYNSFYQSSQTGLPVMRALLLDYPDDPEAVSQNEEFMLGDDLLAAPVVKDGEWKWSVYLPAGEWFDFWSDRRYDGPKSVTVDAPLGRIPLFVRGGAVIPMQQLVQYTDQSPIDPLTFEIYPDGRSEREYYEDDGRSFDYQRGGYLKEKIGVAQTSAGITVEISKRQGSYQPPARSLVVKIHAQHAQPRGVRLNGGELAASGSVKDFESANRGWYYDPVANIIWIKFPATGNAVTAKVID